MGIVTASVHRSSQFLEEVVVCERTAEDFQAQLPHVTLTIDTVHYLDVQAKRVTLSSKSSPPPPPMQSVITPKLIAHHPLIVGLRDLSSVQVLKSRLEVAKRVAVIGNGGIALEVIHELAAWDLVWILREDYVGSAFFDATVSDFILPVLASRGTTTSTSTSTASTTSFSTSLPIPPATTATSHTPSSSSSSSSSTQYGYGLGPEWAIRSGFAQELPRLRTERQGLHQGQGLGHGLLAGSLRLCFNQEVVAYSTDQGKAWQLLTPSAASLLPSIAIDSITEQERYMALWLLTSEGKIEAVDFAISATGVQPDLSFLYPPSSSSSTSSSRVEGQVGLVQGLALDEEGYLLVTNSEAEQSMQTSVPFVFAAGDCCAYRAPKELPFFQMRLWTQARLMGMLAAQSICHVQQDYGLTMHLELFAHITRFFGHKVVLLGRYNAQGLGSEQERAVRTVIIPPHSQPLAPSSSSSLTMQEEEEEEQVVSVLLPMSNHNCDIEVLVRITPLQEVVKLVLYRGRLVGALLIGSTELEEVMENLILNEIDLHALNVDLLNPDLDIADYFD
eukprot:scaffold1296_cov212-Ochromonas_danica.AAC.3